MESQYDHSKHEKKIYELWQEHDAFNPDSVKKLRKVSSKTFSIIMPPPNANDPLHVGHATFV
ncbi:MAG: class I tRNA ligase family protein, partial [Microgenomates group bacterium]